MWLWWAARSRRVLGRQIPVTECYLVDCSGEGGTGCIPGPKDCLPLLPHEGLLYPSGFTNFFITEMNDRVTERQCEIKMKPLLALLNSEL